MKIFYNPTVIAAVVSAIISIITVLIIKPFLEKKFLVFKLEKEHQYNQRKKIKEIIAEHKVRIINDAEPLLHRLRAIVKREAGDPKRIYWPKLGYDDRYEEYFFISTIYRFVSFFNSLLTLKNSMIYFDTTIAEEKDLELMKFIQIFPQLFCGNHLFINSELEITQTNFEKDRFKMDSFLSMCTSFNPKDCTLEEFQNEYTTKFSIKLKILDDFFRGFSPKEENRLRWDVIYLFWFALAAFLNSYGYDYQEVSAHRFTAVLENGSRPRLLYGFIKLLKDNKLDKQSAIKKTIDILCREYKFEFKKQKFK